MIMSSKTLGLDMAVPEAIGESRPGGVLARLLARFEGYQQEKAQQFVRPYLKRLADEDLARLGHGPAEIAAIRADQTPPPAWL